MVGVLLILFFSPCFRNVICIAGDTLSYAHRDTSTVALIYAYTKDKTKQDKTKEKYIKNLFLNMENDKTNIYFLE